MMQVSSFQYVLSFSAGTHLAPRLLIYSPHLESALNILKGSTLMDQEEKRPGGIYDRATNKIDDAKKMASDIAEDAKRQGRAKLDSGKQTAADQTEKLANAVERAAQELGGGEQQSLADYAGQLASSMRSLAENLRGRSIDELLRETQQLARKNPTLFFVGSVAVGVAVSRFLKASSERGTIDKQDRDYDTTAHPGVQPVTFETGASHLSKAPSPNPSSPLDSPSFADDLEKGV
jgi:hypothetical protein